MTIMLIHMNLLLPFALARAHARPEWTAAWRRNCRRSWRTRSRQC